MPLEIIISKNDMGEKDFHNGYPRKSSVDRQRNASQFYLLGKQAAIIDQKLKDLKETMAGNIMQKMELANARMALESILTEVLRRQQLLDDKLEMKLNNGSPIPPLPIEKQAEGGMPQEAGPPPPIAIPPEYMSGPPGGGQEMPSPQREQGPPIEIPMSAPPPGSGPPPNLPTQGGMESNPAPPF